MRRGCARSVVRFCLTNVLSLAAACSGDPAAPPDDSGDVSLLFIGNSHTSVHDVPGILQALADSAGERDVTVSSVARDNYAVIDHWNERTAENELRARRWTYVVLQQGWTPAGVCRDTLRLGTELFAGPIRQAGGVPALFETWPPSDRPGQFAGTIGSYRLAAQDVAGVLFPVAEAWLEAGQRDPGILLYEDGLHANEAGAYLAALVMYARVFGKSPVGLPYRVSTRSGVGIAVSELEGALLQAVAADVGLTQTPPVVPDAAPVITSRC